MNKRKKIMYNSFDTYLFDVLYLTFLFILFFKNRQNNIE